MKTTERNHAIDFTKGALVILMVLYHWLNYFVSTTGDFYRYLRFITGSFIFITGFLIASVHAAKYGKEDSRRYWRLMQRGVKLLLLFTSLNVVINALLSQNYNGMDLGVWSFFQSSYSIYITGSGRRAIFDVLVPISYVLLIAPLLLKLSETLKTPLAVVALGAFVLVLLASAIEQVGGNLELVGMGFLGMGMGGLPKAWSDSMVQRPVLLAGLYLLYLVGVSAWNVIYPIQVAGVCANIWLLFWIADKSGHENIASRLIIELGKYSLFAYVLHILVLQVLRRSVKALGPEVHVAAAAFSLVFALALTMFAVKVVGLARVKSSPADRLYRVVFA